MNNAIIIKKIIKYIEKIMKYCDNISSYSEFSENSMLIESCVFNLSQIGELVNKLDISFKEEHPSVMWHALYGLRNRIVHDYEGVNIRLVWDIIFGDLPETREKIEKIISKTQGN